MPEKTGRKMERAQRDIGQLRLEIAPDTLRRIIGEGRLMELAATVASEAYAQISSQIVEQVAEAALEPEGLQAGLTINVGYIFEGGDFGTVPPRPRWGIGPLRGFEAGGLLSRVAAASDIQQ